jgi:hypothetical protein
MGRENLLVFTLNPSMIAIENVIDRVDFIRFCSSDLSLALLNMLRSPK